MLERTCAHGACNRHRSLRVIPVAPSFCADEMQNRIQEGGENAADHHVGLYRTVEVFDLNWLVRGIERQLSPLGSAMHMAQDHVLRTSLGRWSLTRTDRTFSISVHERGDAHPP